MKTRQFKKMMCIFFIFIFCFGAMNVTAIEPEMESASEESITRAGTHIYAGVTTVTKYKGIQATIKTPTSLPDVSNSHESVWVSTSKDDSGEWVQTGAIFNPSAYWQSFIQYTEHYKSGVYQMNLYDNHELNSKITYKVEFDGEDEKWHAFISGDDVVSGTLDANIMSVQANAEVHKNNIEMGPFTFSRVKVKNGFLEWVNNTTKPKGESPYYVTSSSSATEFTVMGPD